MELHKVASSPLAWYSCVNTVNTAPAVSAWHYLGVDEPMPLSLRPQKPSAVRSGVVGAGDSMQGETKFVTVFS